MNPSTLAAFDTTTVMSLTVITVGLLKPFVELRIAPNSTLHDATLQIVAILSGIAWSFAFMAAAGPISGNAGVGAVATIVLGIGGGSAGVGGYHIASALKTARARARYTPAAIVKAPDVAASQGASTRASAEGEHPST